MKYFTIILFLFFSVYAFGNELVVEGVYQGKSLYIQNPKIQNEKHCITSIQVNGKSFTVQNASAFRLDLLDFKVGTPLKIIIMYSEGCKPRIINPQVIQKKEQFQFLSVSVDEKQLQWQSSGIEDHGRFFIMKQQLNHADMLHVLEIDTTDFNTEFSVDIHHKFGNNTYFLKYLNYTGHVFYSEQVHFYSNIPDTVSFSPKVVEDFITFSEEVNYTITDEKGKLIKQGVAQRVNCTELKSGTYFLDLNNKKNQFTKMKN